MFLLLSSAGMVTNDSSPLVEVSKNSEVSEVAGEVGIETTWDEDLLKRVSEVLGRRMDVSGEAANILLRISFAGTSDSEIGSM